MMPTQQEAPPSKRPIPLAQARAAAEALVRLLTPVCTRIAIAGSVRREKAEVGDIELVAVPRTRASQMDLFGESHGEEDELGAFVALLQNRGVVSDRLDKNGRPANGERFKRLVYHDHQQGRGSSGQTVEAWGDRSPHRYQQTELPPIEPGSVSEPSGTRALPQRAYVR